MIDFLAGALAVLAARGNEIVEKLEQVTGIPVPVVEQCKHIVAKTRRHLNEIEDHQVNLRDLKDSIAQGRLSLSIAEPLIKSYTKGYHDLRRQIDLIEEFFAGHVTRFSTSDEFLTLTASAAWQEGNLPGISPIAVASTSGYFCTLAPLGIVFAPPNDAQKLLILPDLYHEFGHLLHENSSILSDKPRFSQALLQYVYDLEQQARRIARPLPQGLTAEIYFSWLQYWAEEVACDTLAARLVGPAYGWCNLHLCIRGLKIYSGSKHPADAARTRHIFRVLKRCGWATQVAEMEKLWDQYIKTMQLQKPPFFEEYHPDELFIAVMEDVETNTSGIVQIYRPGLGTVGNLLNEAWENFLKDPLNYPVWERPKAKELWEKLKT
jgi:hypothetical protein